MIEQKLKELGIILPEAAEPIGSYIPYKVLGNMIFISGVGPYINGNKEYKGKIGCDCTLEQGYNAARLCGLNLLAILKKAVKNLDNVSQIVQITGYVNSIEGFTKQPEVINGVSDLLIEIFGEAGKHARCAISCKDLPLNIPVEVTMIAEITI